jgi:hypothetical protein
VAVAHARLHAVQFTGSEEYQAVSPVGLRPSERDPLRGIARPLQGSMSMTTSTAREMNWLVLREFFYRTSSNSQGAFRNGRYRHPSSPPRGQPTRPQFELANSRPPSRRWRHRHGRLHAVHCSSDCWLQQPLATLALFECGQVLMNAKARCRSKMSGLRQTCDVLVGNQIAWPLESSLGCLRPASRVLPAQSS